MGRKSMHKYRRHVETNSLPGRANPGRCQKDINAAARPQVKHDFSLSYIYVIM